MLGAVVDLRCCIGQMRDSQAIGKVAFSLRLIVIAMFVVILETRIASISKQEIRAQLAQAYLPRCREVRRATACGL